MPTITPTIYTTDAEQLAALRVPFAVSQVQQRDGGGKTLYYYDGFTIMKRLLDVLGTGLNITHSQPIIDHDSGRVDIEAIMEIRWISGNNTKVSAWGSSDILKNRASDKILNDPIKTAATDSIKCAASKIGVGSELYDAKYRSDLDVRIKEFEEQESRKARLTCQFCGGPIEGCTRTNSEGNVVEMTDDQVANSTRTQFGKRLCLKCGTQASINVDGNSLI
jgi:hypothetical protein